MIEPGRVLQPLAEADPAIRALTDYGSPSEMADAIEHVGAAIDKSLRLLLRSDGSLPDQLRMSALSPPDMPLDRVIEHLRAHDRISIELAGRVHELRQVVERVRRDARAADADLAYSTAERLRQEIYELNEAPVLQAAHHAVASGVLEEPVHSVPPPASRRRWREAALGLGILVALIGILAVVLLLIRRDDTMDQAVAAFEAGRLPAAESAFRQVVSRRPDDVTAYLYLGRIYRRQERHDEASRVLQEAVRLDPADPTVRRELGYLFMDLQRPQAAADQFRRALTDQPDVAANWIGLIRALRAAGDPAAEDLLRRAPPDVRALFP